MPTNRNPRIANQEEGILWMNPGVNQDQPAFDFNQLFRGYTSICRAFEPCKLRVCLKSDDGSEEWNELTFSPGDAIAATQVSHESDLLNLLKARGLSDRAQVSFGEGPPTHAGRVTEERKDKGPPQVGG